MSPLLDANLFETQVSASPGIVSQIITLTPTVANPMGGTHTIAASDFKTSTGQMNYFGTRAYINYLDAIAYDGSTSWRLPHYSPNELSTLFNTQFGGSVTSYTNAANFNLFSNIYNGSYETDGMNGTKFQYVFNTNNLTTTASNLTTLTNMYSVLPVVDGDLGASPTPIPPTAFLFGGGLGALGFIRRKALSLKRFKREHLC